MAIKYNRQSTNKYYGSGNAGYVRSGSSADGLAKALANSSGVVGRADNNRINNKKDKAIEKIQAMEAGGKNLETIQSEILAGKHPDLTGKYVEATTQFHSGKVRAAEIINEITENIDEYDITKTNLNDFYKKFIPNFDGQDTSFMAGFGSQFNGWKAKQTEQDALNRATLSRDKKISEVRTVLSNIPNEDLEERYVKEWKNFGTTLRTSDNSKLTQFYTNEELMTALRADVNSLIETADTPEKIARAEKIMSLNLGKGRDGTELGSLNSRKNTKTDELKAKLTAKKDAITQKVRRDEAYDTAKATQSVWVESFTPNEDGTEKSPLQIQDLLKRITIASKGDVGTINAFTSYYNTDPESRIIQDFSGVQDFMLSVAEGGFTSHNEMMVEMIAQGIPQSEWGRANQRWDRYEKSIADGSIKPIYDRDHHYTNTKSTILKIISEKYKIDSEGLGTKEIAKADVTRYVNNEILDQEDRWLAEGVEVTPKMRKDFILEVQDYVDKTWTGVSEDATNDDYTKPSTTSIEVEREKLIEEEQIQAEKIIEEQEQLKADNTVIFQRGGEPVTLQKFTNEIIENIKTAGKQDFLLAPRIEGIISQEKFIDQIRDPKFQKYIQEVLGSEFNGDILSAMSEDNYRTILINMTTSLGLMDGTDEENNANLNQIQELLFSAYNIEG